MVNLCIAMSLDGYIADSSGSVDFLFEKKRVEPDPEYKKFYEDVDIILFGNTTYRQMVDDISPDTWMYPGKKAYVFSKDKSGEIPYASYTNLSPKEFVETVSNKSDGITWLFGGQKLISSFMKEDLIDQYYIYVLPILLGDGIPLFASKQDRLDLKLTSVTKTDEMVKIFYDRDRSRS